MNICRNRRKIAFIDRAAIFAICIVGALFANRGLAQPATNLDTVHVVGTPPDSTVNLGTVHVTGVRPTSLNLFGTSPVNGIDTRSYSGSGQWRQYILYTAPVSDAKSYSGNCDSQRGNPITITTGNKTESDTDFTTPEEKGLFLTRTWNQAILDRGIFGYNWISNFDKKLIFRWESGATCSPRPGGQCTASQASRLVQILAQRPDGRRIVVYQWGAPNPQNMYPISGSFVGGWTLKVDGENIETYTTGGLIASETNPNGIGWTYTYGGTNNTYLQRVTHTNGRQVNFTWTGDQVSGITDPGGNAYTYTNTTTSATVTYPGTPSTTVTYHFQTVASPAGKVLVGKSFNGVRYSTFAYGSGERANSSEHAGGVEKTMLAYTLNSEGKISQVVETNPLGKTATHTISNSQIMSTTGNASAYCAATVRAYSYTSFGRYDALVDNNGVMRDYDYSGSGQLLKLVEAVGTPAERTTQYTWDVAPKNRLLTETLVGQWSRTNTYTTSGRLATMTEKNLSSFGVANQTRTVTYTYQFHSNGMVSKMEVSTPDQGTTTYDYTSKGELSAVTTPLGQVTTYSLFNGMGLPGRITGPNGDITNYAYDGLGRITNETTYPNGSTAATTSYVYAASGLLSQIVYPDGTSRNFLYDNARRLMGEYLYLGPGVYEYKTMTRDNASNVTSVIVGRSATVPTLGLTAGATQKTYYDFDEVNRVRAVRGNNGQNVTYTYDPNGNVKTVANSLGTTTLTYDALNRATQSKDAAGKTTKFTYNAADQLTKVTDPRGKATSYVYDGFGQLWNQVSPDTGTTAYTYNALGQRTSMTRNDSSATAYTYDGQGRLSGATISGQALTYTYDSCTNGKGRLCGTSGPGSTTAFLYEPDGRLRKRTETITGNGTQTSHATSYAYDAVGRPNAVTYPGGVIVGYGYNSTSGKLTAMTVNIGGTISNVVTGTTYQPFGPATGWTYGNGLSRSYAYDLDGRLTVAKAMNGTSSIQNLAYGYDANDRITGITNAVTASLTQTYSYDVLSRLKTVASTSGNQTFYWDENGNKTRHTWTADELLTVDTASNRTAAMSSHSYTYDSRSNRATQKYGSSTATYSYDGFNRTTGISRNAAVSYAEPNYATVNLPAGTNSYGYNVFNERVWKQTATAGSTRFVYGSGSTLLGERRESDGQWTNYLWFNGELVGLVRGTALYFVHSDHLGRPEVVTNGSKGVAWRASNFAFDRKVTTDSIGGLNVGFPGQYYDAETNLWYNVNRYYDARLGTYTQSDPIGLAGGLNTYAYVENDPVNFIDPLGLAKDTITANIEAAIGRGDVARVVDLLQSGGLNPAQEAIARAGIQRLNMTAEQIIARELKGSVLRRFPGELKGKTLAEILKGARDGDKACQTARKLLTDGRFAK